MRRTPGNTAWPRADSTCTRRHPRRCARCWASRHCRIRFGSQQQARGSIVNTLRDAGHAVIASDITDYGLPLHYRRDFLRVQKMPQGCEAIITNPPYQAAGEFVAHALTLSPHVIMLLRLAFLESVKRTPVLEGGQLARVHVFRNRLPRMHRNSWRGPKASSSIAFAWFVWDRKHSGPTTIDRISWRPTP